MALPDSVLARVASSRSVTVSGFREAWSQLQPPSRPDSLTPQAAREFLDLLIGKEVLGDAALARHYTWTARESAEVRALRDQLVLKVVLDSSLADTKARLAASGHPTAHPESLGTAARDSLVARLDTRFNDANLALLAERFRALPHTSRDSSVMSQIRTLSKLPQVSDAERALPLATSSRGPFLVSELLDSWGRLNPMYRPRVDTPAQVADLARNGIYERELRRIASERDVQHSPAIEAVLARKAEFIAVEHLVGQEVYAKIVMDSTALTRFYDAQPEFWDLPLRARLIELTMPDRAAAAGMFVRLQNAADAETLAVGAARSGVSYRREISAASDSALFAAAQRAGTAAVLGPDSTISGWRVVRVTEMVPPRRRPYTEVTKLVAQYYYSVEGERMMVELMDRLRARTVVVENDRALAAMVQTGIAPAPAWTPKKR